MLKNIIIVDNYSYPRGGTAQVAFQSAMELKKRNYNVEFICSDSEPNKILVDAGINVHCIESKGIKYDNNKIRAAFHGIWNNKVYKEMSNILKKFSRQDTLIHVHGYLHNLSVSIIAACNKEKFKTILTLHDYFIVCPCGGFYNYSKKSICTLKPMSLKCIFCNCDKRNYFQKIWRIMRQLLINRYVKNNNDLYLFYISKFSYSKLLKYIGKNHKTFYLKNPYDVGKEKKYIAEKANFYTYLGRLSDEKGVELLCEAYTQLQKENVIKNGLQIVGDGDLSIRLKDKYSNIIFLGWKNHDDLDNIFKSTRALIFPSKWYEGAPLTPIEFMSRGIPCISSDVCAAVEYIVDERNGLLFKSEDIDSLKKKIKYLDDDKRLKKISSELRDNFCLEEYSVNNHVDNLLELYKEIIGD